MQIPQRKCKGYELMEEICSQINLLEKDYFGLTYEDRYDKRNWLELDKNVNKFIKGNFICLLTRFQEFRRLWIFLINLNMEKDCSNTTIRNKWKWQNLFTKFGCQNKISDIFFRVIAIFESSLIGLIPCFNLS